MHELLKGTFGFPEFYGMNVHALIDCWSDLKVIGASGETMCDFNLASQETLILACKNLFNCAENIITELTRAVGAVNERHIIAGHKPILLICPL